ncbi:MAG: IPT/TIG domain-containing protein, partial [Kangiellaceae bacterium]|nr:IPT/TIG domain-containing protein [Kangiellaceae bacterium]
MKLIQGDLEVDYLGAIVKADDISDAKFEMSRTSGPTRGGVWVTINATKQVILPGTKVLMRSQSGEEIFTEQLNDGTYLKRLFDDVVDLSEFKFRLPGVIDPGLYDVNLIIDGQEYLAGQYSYTLPAGRETDLPNYPPMVMGDSLTQDNHLFIGVKAGAKPTAENRFLMQSGLEIYDTTIWEHPNRLSQLRTEEPVTGLSLVDDILYMANAKDGIAVVDVQDKATPFIINQISVSGYQVNDVDAHYANMILAAAASSDLGDGFVRFFNLADNELSQPAGYSTIVFNQGDLEGQPVKLQWWNQKLYVLFERENQLFLAIFDQFGTQLSYTVQPIDRGLIEGSVNDITDFDLKVQHGSILITSSKELLILEQNQSGEYDTVYWQALENSSAVILSGNGGVYISNSGGLVGLPGNSLVVTGATPENGSEIALDQQIQITFNKLINTDPQALSSAIELSDADGQAIDAESYSLDAENTISGAIVRISFNASTPIQSSQVNIDVNTSLTALSGAALLQPLQLSYQLVGDITPEVYSVNRVIGAQAFNRYFHADGTEQAVIEGINFGTDAAQISISIGELQLDTNQITSIADNRIEFNFPELFLGLESTALPITIERDGVTSTKFGAIIVLPEVNLEELTPVSGPPQGGNYVEIFGSGFTPSTQIYFNSNLANELKVLAAHKIRVKAPSGEFGFADVSAVNPQFPEEISVLSEGYFYAGQETGSVNLSQAEQSPVVSIAKQGQLLYAVTGGGYQVYDVTGKVVSNPTTSTAQLVLIDISDPVNPEVIEKELSGVKYPYHHKDAIAPTGFSSVAIEGNNLFVIGGDKLLHFDISVATSPYLLEEFSNTESIHS